MTSNDHVGLLIAYLCNNINKRKMKIFNTWICRIIVALWVRICAMTGSLRRQLAVWFVRGSAIVFSICNVCRDCPVECYRHFSLFPMLYMRCAVRDVFWRIVVVSVVDSSGLSVCSDKKSGREPDRCFLNVRREIERIRRQIKKIGRQIFESVGCFYICCL